VSISILSYGLGNLGSVTNMLKRVGADARLVSTPAEVQQSERLLLPGVGAFDAGMEALQAHGLVDAIRTFARSGKPVMGICLGMQLLLDGSAEGATEGLGLIPGVSVSFDDAQGLRVPHMGWNQVEMRRPDPLVADLPADSRFYFVHSYRVVPAREEDTLGVTTYGVPFASMIRAGNVMGAQFHPEKSHDFGKQVLRNFAAL